MLFLGNSLTGHGIDVKVVRAELAKQGLASPGVARVWPVSTGAVDWLYLLERYFVDTGQVPDVVVMGFFAHHVPDNDPEMPIKVRRMARHFCGTAHLGDLCRNDLTSYGQRVEAIVSAFSAAFAEQDLFKERAMDGIVPYFRSGERKINSLRMAGAARARPGG